MLTLVSTLQKDVSQEKATFRSVPPSDRFDREAKEQREEFERPLYVVPRMRPSLSMDERLAGILSNISDFSVGDKQNKRNVIVLGVTGSGKSTLINWLAGCDFRYTPGSRNTTISVDESRGGNPEFCEIGHEDSQTRNIQSVPINGTDIVLWDVPGFLDTDGAGRDIPNAVNLFRFMNSCRSRGALILCAIRCYTPDSRLVDLRNMMEPLIRLLGVSNNSFSGVLFCMTRPMKGIVDMQRFAGDIQKLLSEKGVLFEGNVKDHICLADPMGVTLGLMGFWKTPNPKEIRDILLGTKLQPITAGFNIAFTPEAENDLRRMVDYFMEQINDVLSQDFESVLKNLLPVFEKGLKKIAVVEHPFVQNAIQDSRRKIVKYARQQSEVSQRLATALMVDYDNVDTRQQLTNALRVQRLFATAMAAPLDVPEISTMLDNCSKHVLEYEGDLHKKREMDLFTQYENCFQVFKAHVDTCQIQELYHLAELENITLEDLQGVPKAQELTAILASMAKMDTYNYLFLKPLHAAKMLNHCQNQIRECLYGLLERVKEGEFSSSGR
jgi:hypothetical protein